MANDRERGGGRGEDPEALADAIVGGDRRGLARAITLIESTRADHRRVAEAILARLLPEAGRSLRLGISGAPGVGKSTFIEALGLHLVEQGRRVAVLAVDPSSPRSGGSILGDKTRMQRLARAEAAFIRPSPTSGTLGGVARRTRETVLACEAAGFDPVVVETVGVGQSETAVAAMVDMFVLLLAPGGGDELQAIKRGIVELAHLLVVNKADGAHAEEAERARRDYAGALHLLRPPSPTWTPRVMTCSSITGDGIAEVWRTVEAFRDAQAASGDMARRRQDQARASLWEDVGETLRAAIAGDAASAGLVDDLERRVADGAATPAEAARRLIESYGRAIRHDR